MAHTEESFPTTPARVLAFPGGYTVIPTPDREQLTGTARSWLKLATATGANASRLLQGGDLAEAREDLMSMKRSVEMALAALEEAR